MTFPLSCRSCGHVNQTKLAQVGTSISCDGCGVVLKVPPPKEKVSTPGAAEAMVKFACPACGRKFATKADMAGKKIRCSGCGAGVRVPGGAQTPAAEPSRPAVQTVAASRSAAPAAPARPPASEPVQDLGLPKSLFDDEDDEESADPYGLAVDLGGESEEAAEPALPTRAEMLDKARQKATEQEAEEAEEKRKKKKKKKKKKAGYFNARDTWILVGSVGAFVVVLTGIAWAFPGVRFPLGGFLVVVGFITYLIGAFQLRQRVAEEGFIQLILWRFFPPYQWWFVVSRWSETKDFVAFFASGLIILAIGGAVLKTSDVGKRAAAADAALERADAEDGVEVIPLDGDDN